MNNPIHLYNFLAFALVLVAIVLLALAGKATDLAIMTGLVGVLGSFKPWGSAPPVEPKPTQQVEVVNEPGNPVPTTNEAPKPDAPSA